MTLPTPDKLAQQGDTGAHSPKARSPEEIATLFNRKLQPKGITAKVLRKERVLQIALESENIPPQKPLVAFTVQAIQKLAIPSINQVEVYGLQKGEKSPIWGQKLEIITPVEKPLLRVDPPHSNSPQPKHSASSQPPSDRSTRKPTRRKTKQFKYALYLFILTAIFIALSWFNIPYTLPIAVILGLICLVFLVTSEDYQAEQEEFKRKQAQLATRQEWEAKTLAKAKQLEIQENIYQQLVNPETSPVKKLQTNLAQNVLAEFEKLESKIEQSCLEEDLHDIIIPVRTAVQKFTLSDDYEISQYLDNLIDKILLYQEICLECFKIKRQTANQHSLPSAISNKSDLGKLIHREFPTLKTVGLYELTEQKFSNLLVTDLSARYYNFDDIIAASKGKYTGYANQLQQILTVAKG